MPSTVFASGNGLFHKKSGGRGQAFPDVCLTPAGPSPAPVPYPNSLSAADLVDGSRSVKIEGVETALEDVSSISTSMGDEAGNQGGNVLTHKTKGKGYFMLWSFDVKVEGKGVCCHGDPMGQNCASSPMGAADIQAMVNKAVRRAFDPEKPCSQPYNNKKHRLDMVKAQYSAVSAGPCWQCQSTSPLGNDSSGAPLPFNPAKHKFTPDHEPPVMVRWYDGGCNKTDTEWKKDFQDPSSVYAHCGQCTKSQGGLKTHSQVLAERHAELVADPDAAAIAYVRGLDY